MFTQRPTWLALEQELNSRHFERADVIRSLLVGLLARQHVILLGPPGTGKSYLVRNLCEHFDGRFFEWLLTRLSTPEELFGPISLRSLQNDQYRRISTGKLPEADMVFIDEIFKASSAILNTLLPVLNEHVFFNDGQAMAIPLQMLVGASNELPDDREELAALWDRFLIRHVVDYVQEPADFLALLQAPASVTPQTRLTLADLTAAQEAITHVDMQQLYPLLATLRTDLSKMGLVASDRRWRQSLQCIQAQAWLNGHPVADAEDAAILQHILWQTPDQRLPVAKAVFMLISPFDQEAQDILDDAKDAYLMALATEDEKAMDVALEVNKSLKEALQQLEAVFHKSEEAGKPSIRAQNGLQQLKDWGHDLYKKRLEV
jgi:MoxR-like ATPase